MGVCVMEFASNVFSVIPSTFNYSFLLTNGSDCAAQGLAYAIVLALILVPWVQTQ